VESRVNGLHEKPRCLPSSTKQRAEAISNGAEEVAEIIEEVD
jgi:hypothetical protein